MGKVSEVQGSRVDETIPPATIIRTLIRQYGFERIMKELMYVVGQEGAGEPHVRKIMYDLGATLRNYKNRYKKKEKI